MYTARDFQICPLGGLILHTIYKFTNLNPVFCSNIDTGFIRYYLLLTATAMSAILLLKGKEITITPKTTQHELHGKLVTAMGGKLKATEIAEVEISKV